ncbi:DUF4394 domain-containing protein [Hymenobacter sp. M29]|uniref:DUF4394 domain-containing protein n=1 Tax=Hymenobacter mellowenesis TaxID=3063995 RepID=A0ABT9A855_9BACT|nr:DUF4394 domain-containing protein [Hymenobacter sp. M29]MDO7846023.1 DUF4394 domain-containing protein [Hymenobacter sp. M29]
MNTNLLQLPAWRRLLLLVASVLLLSSSATQAQNLIYGLGTLTQALGFPNVFGYPATPAGAQGISPLSPTAGLLSLPVLVKDASGNALILSGRTLVGMDYRPKTGVLYALSYIPASGLAQLYTLDPTTGTATPVVGSSAFTLALGSSVTRIGFDFNPVDDNIRVVATNGNNYRLDPNTGALLSTDSQLAYASGDPNSALTPGVGTAAYTNSYLGATSTALYDIDELNGAILVTQQTQPPTSGALQTVAAINNPASFVNFGLSLGLDIDVYYDAATSTNKAYLIEAAFPNSSGTGAGYSNSNLYSINLANAQTSGKQQVGAANPATPFNFYDIAVPITPPTCTAPTNLAVSSITDNSATVTFTGSLTALNYTVTTSPATTQAPLAAGATSASLTGLAPSTAYTVTITSNCANGTSPASVTFTTTAAPNPTPAITSLSPSSATAGGAAFTLTVNGTGFVTGSTVTFNGTTLTTTYVSASQLTAAVPASAIASAGTYNVTVTSPTPGGGTSNAVTFTVNNPAPVIANLSPASVTAGAAAQTLTVNGTGFVSSSTVSFNGSTRSTAFVSGTQLTIQLTAADQATPGSYPVTVTTPAPGGGTSNTATFTVNPAPCNAPSGLASSNVTSNSATVTFTGSGTATGYTVTTSPATTPQTLPAAATSVSFSGLTPSTAYTVSIVSNCAAGATSSPATVSFTTTAAPLTDLNVNSAQNVQGSYNNVTVTSTGIATLTGPLTVAGTLTVQSGGGFVQNCQPVTGAGSFVLQANANLVICDPAGITASGATGAIQLSGSRSFSPDASYAYNNPNTAQVTGAGLPSRVLNLVVANPAGLSLSQAVSVTQVLRLQTGNLNTNSQALTLLSSAAGTAIVDNTGGVVTGLATVQRYITPTNPGPGYRHYSSPVTRNTAIATSNTVADLATATFTPVVNGAYNSAATPRLVQPYPTVFYYDQARLATSNSSYAVGDFDNGFLSPGALTDVLVAGRGYTVNLSGSNLVDFQGTLNTGPYSTGPLARGAQTTAGYHLLGNPYPSAINYDMVRANSTGLESALYVFKSSGQYTGTYTSYVNGQSTNTGTSTLPVGQGFFVRVASGQTGSVSFTNSSRLTTFDTTPFQRTTADTRPRLTLSLGTSSLRNQTVMYFEAGASAAFDAAFDAHYLPATNGLTLATEAPAGQLLSISGQPALTGADVVLPLQLAAQTAGTYTLAVDDLDNLPAGYHAYLRDALTGTYTDLGTTPTVSLTLAPNAPAGGRYAVVFSTQARVLATASAALAKLATVYPNPAHGSATLLLPVALRGQQATTVSVVDNLGRTVLTRTLAAGATETLELPLGGLATGVYSVQARTASGLVVKRLVVE